MTLSSITSTRAQAAAAALTGLPPRDGAGGHQDIGGALPSRADAVATPSSASIAPLRDAAAAGRQHAVPEGTDAELWAVLTPEERSFFGRTAAVAAPTYGRSGTVPVRSAPAAVRRGLHLDLRA